MDRFSFDDDYVRRLREGDRETAAHFYSYFRDLLLMKLRRRLSSAHAVDEVRQEVFMRTLERLDQVRDGRKLGAGQYFIRIAINGKQAGSTKATIIK